MTRVLRVSNAPASVQEIQAQALVAQQQSATQPQTQPQPLALSKLWPLAVILVAVIGLVLVTNPQWFSFATTDQINMTVAVVLVAVIIWAIGYMAGVQWSGVQWMKNAGYIILMAAGCGLVWIFIRKTGAENGWALMFGAFIVAGTIAYSIAGKAKLETLAAWFVRGAVFVGIWLFLQQFPVVQGFYNSLITASFQQTVESITPTASVSPPKPQPQHQPVKTIILSKGSVHTFTLRPGEISPWIDVVPGVTGKVSNNPDAPFQQKFKNGVVVHAGRGSIKIPHMHHAVFQVKHEGSIKSMYTIRGS